MSFFKTLLKIGLPILGTLLGGPLGLGVLGLSGGTVGAALGGSLGSALTGGNLKNVLLSGLTSGAGNSLGGALTNLLGSAGGGAASAAAGAAGGAAGRAGTTAALDAALSAAGGNVGSLVVSPFVDNVAGRALGTLLASGGNAALSGGSGSTTLAGGSGGDTMGLNFTPQELLEGVRPDLLGLIGGQQGDLLTDAIQQLVVTAAANQGGSVAGGALGAGLGGGAGAALGGAGTAPAGGDTGGPSPTDGTAEAPPTTVEGLEVAVPPGTGSGVDLLPTALSGTGGITDPGVDYQPGGYGGATNKELGLNVDEKPSMVNSIIGHTVGDFAANNIISTLANALGLTDAVGAPAQNGGGFAGGGGGGATGVGAPYSGPGGVAIDGGLGGGGGGGGGITTAVGGAGRGVIPGGSAPAPAPISPFSGRGAVAGSSSAPPDISGLQPSSKPNIFPWVRPDQSGQGSYV